MWVAPKRVEGVGIEKVDSFYKHVGDTMDKIGNGETKGKGKSQRIPRF